MLYPPAAKRYWLILLYLSFTLLSESLFQKKLLDEKNIYCAVIFIAL